ncbi:hypothetical protein [Hymenobacter sp. BT730]|uniref:hypothetical protein n=1 Tax=Hymenobacter sp. BT730 TaxID=3063332 RepID=UPI0026DF6182|nr:hypothetical protein [Hymenobacter sp. BT730]
MAPLPFLLHLVLVHGVLNAGFVLGLTMLHRLRGNPKTLGRVLAWSLLLAVLGHVLVLLQARYSAPTSVSWALVLYTGSFPQRMATLQAISLLSVATPYVLGKYHQSEPE